MDSYIHFKNSKLSILTSFLTYLLYILIQYFTIHVIVFNTYSLLVTLNVIKCCLCIQFILKTVVRYWTALIVGWDPTDYWEMKLEGMKAVQVNCIATRVWKWLLVCVWWKILCVFVIAACLLVCCKKTSHILGCIRKTMIISWRREWFLSELVKPTSGELYPVLGFPV